MKFNIKQLLLLLLSSILLVGCTSAPTNDKQETDNIVIESGNFPIFNGKKPYVVLNNNVATFSDDEKNNIHAFEKYQELDVFGRTTAANANLHVSNMPSEDRESIGMIKPSGWITAKYDFIDGKYLYNRCHLIGFQLAGENANEKNLITGTRYLNVTGMLPFENKVASYLKKTNNHVLYRVTPVYKEGELVARGVIMEAYSVEDKGKGIHFNIYCFNNQPGVTIDYMTGKSQLSDEKEEGNKGDEVNSFVVNKNSKKFHAMICPNSNKISDKNKETKRSTVKQLLNDGYVGANCCINNRVNDRNLRGD